MLFAVLAAGWRRPGACGAGQRSRRKLSERRDHGLLGDTAVLGRVWNAEKLRRASPSSASRRSSSLSCGELAIPPRQAAAPEWAHVRAHARRVATQGAGWQPGNWVLTAPPPPRPTGARRRTGSAGRRQEPGRKPAGPHEIGSRSRPHAPCRDDGGGAGSLDAGRPSGARRYTASRARRRPPRR